jgi:hypothetical protein
MTLPQISEHMCGVWCARVVLCAAVCRVWFAVSLLVVSPCSLSAFGLARRSVFATHTRSRSVTRECDTVMLCSVNQTHAKPQC